MKKNYKNKKKEIEENGKMIDREINEHNNTQIYKIRYTDISKLDFEAISINNLPYQESSLDTTLEISKEIDRYLIVDELPKEKKL